MPLPKCDGPSSGAAPSTRDGSSSGGAFPPTVSETDEAAEYAEALGASSPLLDLIDTLFELKTRGFVVRQVCCQTGRRTNGVGMGPRVRGLMLGV